MPIQHFFVLMLENRSFDHVFGFSTIPDLDKPDPATDSNIDPVTGISIPVAEGADFSLKGVDADPGHEFEDVLRQLAGPGAQHLQPGTGKYPPITNKGFVDNYRTSGSGSPGRIMKCFSPDQLPVINQLASEFVLCDHWYASLPGPTWPNRFFMMAATSGGLTKSPSTGDIIQATAFAGYGFEHGNIFDALDRQGIEWVIFEGDKFPVSFALKGMNDNRLKGRFVDFANFEQHIGDPAFGSKFIFIEPQYGSHKFDVTGPGDFSGGNSMHPLDDVRNGEALIKQVYETIRKFPSVWNNAALLIVFDEHGGFYDHATPPTCIPPGDNSVNAAGGQEPFLFDQLGVRVPALVISPLVTKGAVDHRNYDHASALATVERIFGVGSLTQRDNAAIDLGHLFSLATPRTDTPDVLSNPAPSSALETMAPEPVDTQDKLKRDLVAIDTPSISSMVSPRANEPLASDPQVGFAYVALMRAMGHADTEQEKEEWKNEFRGIRTRKDAARFMTRAKLRVYFNEYVKR
jgi:phospholipase C